MNIVPILLPCLYYGIGENGSLLSFDCLKIVQFYFCGYGSLTWLNKFLESNIIIKQKVFVVSQ